MKIAFKKCFARLHFFTVVCLKKKDVYCVFHEERGRIRKDAGILNAKLIICTSRGAMVKPHGSKILSLTPVSVENI